MKSNLVYSVLGILFNMLFPLVVYPYITRVLGADNLGQYSFYTSSVSYLALLAAFGIPLYGTKEIGRLKNDRAACSRVFGELLALNLVMCLMAYGVIALLMRFSAAYQNTALFLVASLTLICNAIGAEYLFVALEKQRFMLLRNICFKLLALALILVFVKSRRDLMVYACIMLLSTAGVSMTNLFCYRKIIAWHEVRLRTIRLRAYLAPVFQIFVIDLLIHFYGYMDVVILGLLDTSEAVGYYSVASKIYLLTYSLLAATAVPLLPRAAYYLENRMTERYNRMMRRCYDLYLLMSLPCASLLFFFAEEIVRLVAGAGFAAAAAPLRWLALTLPFSSLCNFFTFQAFYPKGRGAFILSALLTSVAVYLAAARVLIPARSCTGASIAFFAAFATLFAIMLLGGRKHLPRFSNYRDLFKALAALAGCILCGILLKVRGAGLLVNGALCVSVYAAGCLLLRNTSSLYLYGLVADKLRTLSKR